MKNDRKHKRYYMNNKAWKAKIILVPLNNERKRKEFYEKWVEVFIKNYK